MKKLVSVIVAMGLSAALYAADEAKEFKGHAELSYANTAGNTDSQDVAGNLKLNLPFSSNEIRFVGNALYSDTTSYDENGTYIEDLRTKNRWDAEANYDYNFNEAIAFNYILGGKGDEFSTFVYQVYTGPGAIVTAVKNDEHHLKFQANVLYLWDKVREDSATIPVTSGYMHRYSGYQASMDYIYQVTKNAKFGQYLMYRSEFEDTTNYFIKSKTYLESKVSDVFSMGMSYTVDYTNNKAASVRSYTDAVFLASLIADF